MGGYYAMPQREWLKIQALIKKLPELKKQVADIGSQVQELRKSMPNM
jgi:UDP-3-O-[3-hydroxymyristoyl] glucosamine N-acyltransferase